MEDLNNFICPDFTADDFLFCVPEGMVVPLAIPVEDQQEAQE
jgi:hypothetical protein